MENRTAWFPMTALPTRVGWYETSMAGGDEPRRTWMRFFDGKGFLLGNSGTGRVYMYAVEHYEWRGLTSAAFYNLDDTQPGITMYKELGKADWQRWAQEMNKGPKTWDEFKRDEQACASREAQELSGKLIGKTAADEMHGFMEIASELPTIKEVDESLRSYIDREYKTDPITRARAEEIVSRFEHESLLSKLVFVTAVARDTQRVATFASLEKFHTMLKDLCRVILWLSTKELPDLDADAEQLLKKKRYVEQAKEALEKLNGTR